MKLRKKNLIFTILLIGIILTLVNINNNNNKTIIRFLIWTSKEYSIAKIITASFLSGLTISTILNISLKHHLKVKVISNDKNNYSDKKDNELNFDIPPQRDIRETQPTISVNYRVVKNTNDEINIENNNQSSNNKSNNYEYDSYDWGNQENEW